MARRGGRPKKDPASKEWTRQPLIEKALQEAIATYGHSHLERAKIVAVARPGAAKRTGCCRVLRLKTVSHAVRALCKDELGEIHYQAEVRIDAWTKLEQAARQRALDHALCHAGGLDDKDRWFILEPDCLEFVDVLKRHGVDETAGLRSFVRAAKQLGLHLEPGQA